MDEQIFEKIKRVNEYGKEYRYARELSRALEYADFSNFSKVVQKAEVACKNSGQATTNHFSEFTEKVKIGSGATRWLKSRKLSRYACYLIIQNADPNKEVVALGQTYFALQTRQQELNIQKLEDQKRIQLRDEVTQHNKRLFSTARSAGVHDYATFYDSGYVGLYGMRKRDIVEKKGLDQDENVLDRMSSEELAANLFRATQAEAKIKRETIRGQEQASKAHFEVGKKIRSTIQELWGTMPEDIPAVEDIKLARKRLEELEYQDPQKITTTESVSDNNFQKVQEKLEMHRYKLPDQVEKINTLIQIIQAHPGELLIEIGKRSFSVNVTGLQQLQILLQNHKIEL